MWPEIYDNGLFPLSRKQAVLCRWFFSVASCGAPSRTFAARKAAPAMISFHIVFHIFLGFYLPTLSDAMHVNCDFFVFFSNVMGHSQNAEHAFGQLSVDAVGYLLFILWKHRVWKRRQQKTRWRHKRIAISLLPLLAKVFIATTIIFKHSHEHE